MIKIKTLIIFLIFNIYHGFSQNKDSFKFKPDFVLNFDDSLANELNSHNNDSSSFYGLDDTEFCIQFLGGDDALKKYLKKSIVIPKDSITSIIEGKIYVSFTVNEMGKVENVVIEKGLNDLIDKIIFKAISEMPDWIWNCKEKPNRKITVKRYLPITIRQNNEKK